MFPDLVRLINRRPSTDYDRGFVRAVRTRGKPPRNPRVELILKLGWTLIMLKSVAVVWLFEHYHVQVSALWVIAPTFVFGALCTAVYLLRD